MNGFSFGSVACFLRLNSILLSLNVIKLEESVRSRIGVTSSWKQCYLDTAKRISTFVV